MWFHNVNIRLFSVLFLVLTLLHYSGLVWRGIMIAVMGLCTFGAMLWGCRVNRPSARYPWLLLAAAILFFAAGDTTYSMLTDVMHLENPFPSLADVFYLITFPLFALGLVFLIKPHSIKGYWGNLLDALILTAGIALLVWIYLIVNYVVDAVPLGTKIISIAYPLWDVVVWSLMIRLLMIDNDNAAVKYLALGAAGLFVSDIIYAIDQISQQWLTGTPKDLGWILFYYSWGVATLHPSMAKVTQPPRTQPANISTGRVATLLAFSLIAPFQLLAEVIVYGTAQNPVVISIFSSVLFLLVIMRLQFISREKAALQRENYFRSIVHQASDVFLIIGDDDAIRYASPSAEKLWGRALNACDKLADLMPMEALGKVFEFVSNLRRWPGNTEECEWRINNGHAWVEAEIRGNNLRHDPAINGIVLTLRDVTRQKMLEQELTRKAFHDGLTGLANHTLFQQRLEHAFARIKRDSGLIAVIYIDLDDFKVVNDTLGHPTGDALLKAVSQRIANSLRGVDTAARLGGDEFAVIVEDCYQHEQICTIVSKLSELFLEPYNLNNIVIQVSASIGIATSLDGETPEEIQHFADLALYKAKSSGKGRWQHYEAHPQATMA